MRGKEFVPQAKTEPILASDCLPNIVQEHPDPQALLKVHDLLRDALIQSPPLLPATQPRTTTQPRNHHRSVSITSNLPDISLFLISGSLLLKGKEEL